MRLATVNSVGLNHRELAIFVREAELWRKAMAVRRGMQPLVLEGATKLPATVARALRSDGFSGQSAPIFAGEDEAAR